MLLDGLVQSGLAEHEAANGYPQTQEPRHGRRQAADRQHTRYQERHVPCVIRYDTHRERNVNSTRGYSLWSHDHKLLNVSRHERFAFISACR